MVTIAWGIQDLKIQYENTSSGHWFDKDTMRFFKTRLTSNYRRIDDANALFITTEQNADGIRRATVRHARLLKYIRESDKRICNKIVIRTVGKFHSLSLHQAKKLMNEVVL